MYQDFWATETGQFIAQSVRYFRAASVIRKSDSWGVELQSPTLHLVAHGVELLCKVPLIMSGLSQVTIRREYGHDLSTLWALPENTNLRAAVYREAEMSWALARNSGAWPHDNFDEDPTQTIDEALIRLSFLHGKSSNFALRYTLDKDTVAPRPAFLIDVFGGVSDRVVKNPQYIKM